MLSSKWRVTAGACVLLASAIGQLAQYVVAPAHVSSGTAADQVAALAGHGSRIELSIWLDLLILLVIPAALYLGLLAGAKTSKLATVGTAVTFAGSLGAGYLLALDPLIYFASQTTDHAGAVELLSAYESSGIVTFMVIAGVLGTTLGYVLLGIAMIRTRRMPIWVGASVAAAAVLEIAGQGAGVEAVAIAAYCLRLAAFGACAVALYRYARLDQAGVTQMVAPVPV